MKVENKVSLTESKREIEYTHIINGSNVICFMLSGAGYTYDKPLFYYSTMVMLENNFDVVHIHYSYKDEERHLPIDEFTQLMVGDVNSVVKDVLENPVYSETIFLGKSLGTIPIVAEFIRDSNYEHTKIVLLTPLLKMDWLYKRILESTTKTFLVIGDKDTHYFQDKMRELEERSNLNILKVNNANHSLEFEPFNTSSSLKILAQTMDRLKAFLGS